MPTLLIATTNANKVREITPLVSHLALKLLTLAALPPIPAPVETGHTFWENARAKALAYAAATGLTVVAEDSGLEIAALGGAPGVQSARFLGPDTAYPVRFVEIYKRLAGGRRAGLTSCHPSPRRDARFVTALAVGGGDEILFEAESWIDGEVSAVPAGDLGFGYDPIFLYRPLGKTTGEMTRDEKAAVSHRARAFRDFARWVSRSPMITRTRT